MIQSSNLTRWRVSFERRKCWSLRPPKCMTCWLGKPIAFVKKLFIRFVLEWKPLCMGLQSFPPETVGNSRCVWTESDKWQPLGQRLIVRGQYSNWSTTYIRWHLWNAGLVINFSNVISDYYSRKAGLGYAVPVAHSPKTLQWWNLPPKMRHTRRQTWLLAWDSNFRSLYSIQRKKPRPGAWLIRS